ncbi:endonuclease SmrB [Pasteurellaceae bacterium LIM206]|nr:endonuclease SmrB [Pasteurellaceae bacterium LIM206]
MLEKEDINLFLESIRGAKKMKQDTVVAKPMVNVKKKSTQREIRETADTLFYFSDEYEPLLKEDEGVVKYLREGEDSYLLKQLRRGDFSPELFLDLHGLTREQAKLELAALLQACVDENVFCASVMTGYGTYTLKRQIPRWLVQHPRVRALHQAPKEWGGDAAILMLVEV